MELLKEQKVTEFGYFNILNDNNVRQGIKTYSNWKTFPQFYVNGELIGGLDIIKDMIESNELNDILPQKVTKKSKDELLNERIKKLIESNDIMIFIKGTPTAPECGFSRKIINLLKQEGINKFGYFNILTDNDIRQGIKKYSNWPTFPQLYIKNELIGGLDVVSDMIDAGELIDELSGIDYK